MRPLYVPHPPSLALLYGDIENHALLQHKVFVGTAGSVNERSNAAGFRFYAHQYYDGDGKKRETYIAGPIGAPEVEAVLDALRERIRDTQELVPSLRLLGREGFHLVDRKTYATLAAIHNHHLFAGGAVLIGSHAFGVLLNRLAARATPYATEDIDIARRQELAIASATKVTLLDILRESGIAFFEVPGFAPNAPATSFKEQGRSRFHVDLLVPSPDESFPILPVPELGAHAIGLPYLDYLIEESQLAALLSREGACTVRVPLPERFAIHKLIVSQLRSGRSAKSEKDIHQATVLSAVLAKHHPGALEDAVSQVPRHAVRHLKMGLQLAKPILELRAPQAWEALQDLP